MMSVCTYHMVCTYRHQSLYVPVYCMDGLFSTLATQPTRFKAAAAVVVVVIVVAVFAAC